MGNPIVAIVGRPNVGKSNFFNYLIGKRISIVEDTPGVTRDRIYAETEWRGRKFTLIDTGGIEPENQDEITAQMRRQAEIAMEMADVILFMVDIKDGLVASDKEVARIIRKSKKPVILVCNKVDNVGAPPAAIYEFYELGLGEPVPVSAIHGLGIGEVLDEAYNHFPAEQTEEDDDSIKVAVVGKPNAGKSSLVNRILGENRVIVSDVPGTTRDAIDTEFKTGDDRYIFIDTAGIRKRSRIDDMIEKYSVLRAFTAVDRADVCLIIIDAVNGVTEQDTKIAGYAHEKGKASVIVVNKWDIMEKETGTLEKYRQEVYSKLAFMTYAPIVFISAKTGQRVNRLFELIKFTFGQNSMRISTGMINDVINEAIAIVQPPSDKGRRLKIYYATQVSVKPPKFVIFVNNAQLMHFSYERYLENQIRKNFGFEGTPIWFSVKEKKDDKK
ncbi:MAG: ribosome biogenesis GTPase Der [Deltaproteobacteria bacterium]